MRGGRRSTILNAPQDSRSPIAISCEMDKLEGREQFQLDAEGEELPELNEADAEEVIVLDSKGM